MLCIARKIATVKIQAELFLRRLRRFLVPPSERAPKKLAAERLALRLGLGLTSNGVSPAASESLGAESLLLNHLRNEEHRLSRVCILSLFHVGPYGCAGASSPAG